MILISHSIKFLGPSNSQQQFFQSYSQFLFYSSMIPVKREGGMLDVIVSYHIFEDFWLKSENSNLGLNYQLHLIPPLPHQKMEHKRWSLYLEANLKHGTMYMVEDRSMRGRD